MGVGRGGIWKEHCFFFFGRRKGRVTGKWKKGGERGGKEKRVGRGGRGNGKERREKKGEEGHVQFKGIRDMLMKGRELVVKCSDSSRGEVTQSRRGEGVRILEDEGGEVRQIEKKKRSDKSTGGTGVGRECIAGLLGHF
ncbi:hypothetical protein Tco_0231113 [Tanacetum coccineum]